MMYNEKPNLSFVKLLGCVAFMQIEKPFCNKLDQTSKKGIFYGNCDKSKCYLVGFGDEKGELKIRKSRNGDLMKMNFPSNIRKHNNWSKTLIMIQMRSLF